MVVPSTEMTTEVELPLTMLPPVCAPVSVKWISLTPVPPVLSVAVNVTVTFVLFQPAPLGSGESCAVVTGGVTSGTQAWSALDH